MSKASRLLNFLCQSSFVRSYSFLWVLPIFIIQLCLYLNVSDRPDDPLFFLQVAIAVFFVMATVLYAVLQILGLISKRIYAHLLNMSDIFFVAFFIIAVFFPIRHAVLDGQKYPPVLLFETIKQFLVFIIVIAISFVLLKKKIREFKILQATMLAASIIFIIYSTLSMSFDYKNTIKPTEVFCDLGKRNVILLIVETFQGNYLEELATEAPEVFDSFTGMTLFPKAVTSVTWSSHSTVQIFSGNHEWSKYKTEQEAIKALNLNSVLATTREYGYRFSGGRYMPEPGGEYVSLQDENVSMTVRAPIVLIEHSRYYFASLRRVTPAIAWNRVRELEAMCLTGLRLHKIASKNSFIGMTQCLRAGDSNAFLYFFNYMTHIEILFDRHGNAIRGLPQNKTTQLEEYRYALSLYSDFLNKLKSIGAYDDSLIIILGDHGAYNELMRSYNPAVFIKPPHAEGKLAISHANVLHTDIRPLVEAYVRNGDNAFSIEFAHLLQKTGPREIPIYTRPALDAWSGRNYKHRTIFGDIETVISELSKK